MTRSFQKNDVRKILVISLSNLGDVILTTPVFSVLKGQFPKAFLSVVTGPKAEPLLEGSCTVDEVIVYDKKNLNFFQKIKFVFELRKKHFDLVIDLRNTLIPYLIHPFSYRNRFVFGKTTASMRERHLSHLDFLNIPKMQTRFDFFSEKDREECQTKLKSKSILAEKGFMVIAPGAGSYLKRWRIEGFSNVAHYFSSQGKQIVVVGSEKERELGDQIEANSYEKIVNMCGSLSLRELAALLHGASLVLCCDSGVMHLANELNAPVVAIFGPTDERKYAKFGPHNRVVRKELDCTPCELAHCRFDRQYCMEDIATREVIQTCEELLGVHAH